MLSNNMLLEKINLEAEGINIATLKSILLDNGMDAIAEDMPPEDIEEVARYTIQKINTYPKEYGHTVESYFHLLFPDEIKNHIQRVLINMRFMSQFETRLSLPSIVANEEAYSG